MSVPLHRSPSPMNFSNLIDSLADQLPAYSTISVGVE